MCIADDADFHNGTIRILCLTRFPLRQGGPILQLLFVLKGLLGHAMPLTLTHRVSFALPILFYLLALAALWLHLPTDDVPMLIVAVLAGVLGIGIGVAVVLHHRVMIDRVSSRA
jgi:hypothetical protein